MSAEGPSFCGRKNQRLVGIVEQKRGGENHRFMGREIPDHGR